MDLKAFFEKHSKVALCFSGGVDSSYLLYAGLHYGAQIQPYYLKTEFQPEFELDDARQMSEHLGVELKIIEQSIFENDKIFRNDERRCYHCKSEGMGRLYKQARQDGYEIVIDGSNADDDPKDRPGMKALEEIGILSPLRLANLTKPEIRIRSKEAGLFTWDKPAYACLATRIPTNQVIEEEMLLRVEKSETLLFDLGFNDVRVRVLGRSAKLELLEEDFIKAIQLREQIVKNMDFEEIFLDLSPRTT